jgi:hypothetical protein
MDDLELAAAVAGDYGQRAQAARLRREAGEAAVVAVGRSVIESGAYDDPEVIDAAAAGLAADLMEVPEGMI